MSCATTDQVILFDPTEFRTMFPEYSNQTTYPDSVLQMMFDQATCVVSDCNYGWLAGSCRKLTIYLVAAHLLTIFKKTSKGWNASTGFKTASTIDDVSVQRLAPPAADQFSWWLNGSPYGQQALAILDAVSVGGLSIGGLPELLGFRRIYGVFL